MTGRQEDADIIRTRTHTGRQTYTLTHTLMSQTRSHTQADIHSNTLTKVAHIAFRVGFRTYTKGKHP